MPTARTSGSANGSSIRPRGPWWRARRGGHHRRGRPDAGGQIPGVVVGACHGCLLSCCDDRQRIAQRRKGFVVGERSAVAGEHLRPAAGADLPAVRAQVVDDGVALAGVEQIRQVDVETVAAPLFADGLCAFADARRRRRGGTRWPVDCPAALSAVMLSNSRSCASGGRYTSSPSALHAVGWVASKPLRRRAAGQSSRRSMLTVRRSAVGSAPMSAIVVGLELDDLRLVDLVDDAARRPRQPIGPRVQAGRQDHRLPDAGGRLPMKKSSKNRVRTAITSVISRATSPASPRRPSGSRRRSTW